MIAPAAYFWKRAPFLRILPGLVSGIMIEWYARPGFDTWLKLLPLPLLLLVSFSFISYFRRYSLPALPGITAILVFTCIGGMLAWQQNITNNEKWFGKNYEAGNALLLTINAPLVEKERSWRADANVNGMLAGNGHSKVRGKIIIYFSKDSLPAGIGYGTRLITTRPLQEIRRSSNPGTFDFKRYCLFQGITHQVFLKAGDIKILPGKKTSGLEAFVFTTKENILDILRQNIPGDKEAGLAEALLLGYKNDLDKTLVQSYSNTGVVHVIAVSGLHLGLVYMLLMLFLKPLRSNKRTRWLGALLIIAGLWLFTLLAGAQASVLRSALMFSCIVIGENLARKTSVFNTMAVSAFMLICIDPFIIWDVGFQLSYAAVASIIIFMKPVYNLIYFRNPILDTAWKMNAVTISAQILTIPFTLYHFNQFPSWFLVTNFVAVPLSSIILLGEIFLCAISFIPVIAILTGKCLAWLISIMNSYIGWVETMPYALMNNIQLSTAGAFLLFLVIAGMAWWLMGRSVHGLKLALVSILLFVADDRGYYAIACQQQKIVVYDVPKKTAIDFISGRSYRFIGDGSLITDMAARRFHLEPARTRFRVNPGSPANCQVTSGFVQFAGKRILLPRKNARYGSASVKPQLDFIIITGNQYSRIDELSQAFRFRKLILDSSVPARAAGSWKKDCVAAGINFHDVAAEGAFVMNL